MIDRMKVSLRVDDKEHAKRGSYCIAGAEQSLKNHHFSFCLGALSALRGICYESFLLTRCLGTIANFFSSLASNFPIIHVSTTSYHETAIQTNMTTSAFLLAATGKTL